VSLEIETIHLICRVLLLTQLSIMTGLILKQRY